MISNQHFQPDIDRVLSLGPTLDNALEAVRWGMLHSPVNGHELKGRLQMHTAQLINDWEQLEEEFDERALSALLADETIDEMLQPGKPISELQHRATDLLYTYAILFAAEAGFVEAEKQHLLDFLNATGLAGVWGLLPHIKLLSNLPTENLSYATSTMRNRIGHLKMSLHLHPAHYIYLLSRSKKEA